MGLPRRTRGYVLWVPFYVTGELVGLPHAEYPEEFCLPVFDSPIICRLWIQNQQGLDEGTIVPSKPLYPYALKNLLYNAEDSGFVWIMLNPPYSPSHPREMRSIDDLIEQVEELV